MFPHFFFKFFLKKNNPPLFGRKDGLLTDNRGLSPAEVILAEVLAVGGQLVVNQRGQQLLQLQEESFAGLVRTGRLFLVVGLGLFLFLPFQEFVFLSLVVLAEITANGIRKILELTLIVARMSHQIGHHARRFLPSIVRIEKFRAADVCAKNGEKHRNEGFMSVF